MIQRCDYLVQTNTAKTNGQKPTSQDLINVGYTFYLFFFGMK